MIYYSLLRYTNELKIQSIRNLQCFSSISLFLSILLPSEMMDGMRPAWGEPTHIPIGNDDWQKSILTCL